MKILGVSFETHESSVALMEDDRVLFAAAEERYSRIKMDNSTPVLSLKEFFPNCYQDRDEYGINLSDGHFPASMYLEVI